MAVGAQKFIARKLRNFHCVLNGSQLHPDLVATLRGLINISITALY
jgi:hypothetical protein